MGHAVATGVYGLGLGLMIGGLVGFVVARKGRGAVRTIAADSGRGGISHDCDWISPRPGVTPGPSIDLKKLPPPDMLAPQLAVIGADPATGLPGRESFLESLEEHLAAAHETGSSLSLTLVAIDDLEHFHQRFGGAAGDALLRVVTQIIRSTSRASSDHVGIYSHDTIGVILVGASAIEAKHSANRMRRALAHCRLRDEGRDLSFSVRVGSAELPERGDLQSLTAAAEHSLASAQELEPAALY